MELERGWKIAGLSADRVHSDDGREIYDSRAEKDVIDVMNPGCEVGLVHFRVHAHTHRTHPASSAG